MYNMTTSDICIVHRSQDVKDGTYCYHLVSEVQHFYEYSTLMENLTADFK